MKTINLLLFFFLFSYVAKAQDKSASKQTKDTIRETKISSITEPKPVQPTKIIICAPSKSELMQIVYVLDGKIIDKVEFSKINPKTIESVKALKMNEAKSIYGERGANGAIILTSKK
ncbi:hypothetical protein [Flavobacterium quisquiliarum]|uniref:TonB-dependent receptor plug domain-containing protein n=1 Tax=Flavobacterium quisquiliarum TaxID=1834436 RepID=A0ABV8W8H6_9FLAO|nr:hypothetical protein [Flavobacterium quisquiliarum]MBW1654869.1 hypothetical protein [Flavobacterium quisquiliarum]NWL00290.1 hypothetical protein [Flavobacterium collinsii]